jgi:hypothetical protein
VARFELPELAMKDRRGLDEREKPAIARLADPIAVQVPRVEIFHVFGVEAVGDGGDPVEVADRRVERQLPGEIELPLRRRGRRRPLPRDPVAGVEPTGKESQRAHRRQQGPLLDPAQPGESPSQGQAHRWQDGDQIAGVRGKEQKDGCPDERDRHEAPHPGIPEDAGEEQGEAQQVQRREWRLPPHGRAVEDHVPGEADEPEEGLGGNDVFHGFEGDRIPGGRSEDAGQIREDRIAGMNRDPGVRGSEHHEGREREQDGGEQLPAAERQIAKNEINANGRREEEPQVFDPCRRTGERGGEQQPGSVARLPEGPGGEERAGDEERQERLDVGRAGQGDDDRVAQVEGRRDPACLG